LLRKLILIASLIGFLYQVIQVSRQYFAFATTIRIEYVAQETLKTHEIALCVRYNDILDIESLKRDTGVSILRLSGNESLEAAVENDAKLTISMIFNYTPSCNDLMKGCLYRSDNYDLREAESSEECTARFKIKRFLTQERMCYHISDIKSIAMHRDYISLSTYSPFVLYSIHFKQQLAHADMVSVIAFRGKLPLLSRAYASPPDSLYSDGVKQSNQVAVTPSDTIIKSLEWPYVSNCIDVTDWAMYQCEFDCLREKMSKYKRLPAWHLILEQFLTDHPEAVDYKLNSLADARNETINEPLKRDSRSCSDICFSRNPCNFVFTRTEARVSKLGSSPLIVKSMAPPDPDVIATDIPRMTFIDFFSFIASCFGTWFGVSFLSFDRLIRQRAKRMTNGDMNEREIVLEYASFGKAREISKVKSGALRRKKTKNRTTNE
jgi:hypothetical protein